MRRSSILRRQRTARAIDVFDLIRRKSSDRFVPGFDPVFYEAAYPDVGPSGLSPTEHYLTIGRAELRDPNAFFSAKGYRDAHPDVAAAGFDPLTHFLLHGLAQNYGGWQRAATTAMPHGTTEKVVPSVAAYRVPDALTVTDAGPRTILVIGSCLVQNLIAEFARIKPVQGDFVLANFASQLPDTPPRGLTTYDLQIVQLPLRTILPDSRFARQQYHRPDHYAALLEDAELRLATMLDAAMAWNKASGLTTFVINFLRPQQNPLGRLLPRNDLQNFGVFIDRLNQRLAELVAGYTDSHILDVDEISATVGRIHLQDDHLWMINHNATVSDFDHEYDQARLHPPAPVSWQSDLKIQGFFAALQAEVEAMYRTIRQIDAVKLVIVDLDDTLWRGVIAEDGDISPTVYEGWPLGMIEALAFVKNRGIVLAIASKNDEARIRAIWDPLMGGRLQLTDFGVIRINWKPKVDNVAEILREVNVLPGNTVFIDDNPVEREAVKAAFPGIRTLGADLYGIRRTLLWAPEMQAPFITDESGRRTEMVQAQVVREQTRATLTREEFLATLEIRITPSVITDPADSRFRRALELINKTNQFNTTGQRWTLEAMQAALRAGVRLHAFEVVDKFTDYGLVGVIVLDDSTLVQCVMSCRVVGLDVETAMLAQVEEIARQARRPHLSAAFVTTERNTLCLDLYRNHGYRLNGDHWIKDLA
ncbi:HAD-IIIC family phosphatase [Methylobacterium sp. WL116]|uniref:HAD-IIIC family phosphatase n=1 Tax=Methylobacterium sp. WL116 TaxID=2603889 RepID=UPI0011CC1DA0|nr:HAD-IIIC family phosphatase [Methylobacterium sp. WL116]